MSNNLFTYIIRFKEIVEMTIGTAIVVSIGILCATFLAACVLGVYLQNKKTTQVKNFTENIMKNIKKE